MRPGKMHPILHDRRGLVIVFPKRARACGLLRTLNGEGRVGLIDILRTHVV